MKKFLTLLFIVGVAVLMTATCPNEEAHRQVIKERLNKAVKAEVDEKVGKGFGSIGSVFTKPVVKSVLKRKFHVDNYVVLSIGRLEMKDSEQIISVGLLNHVFTGSSERFQQEIDKALQGKKADSEEQEEWNRETNPS